MGVSSDLSSLASYVHEAEAQTFRANIGKPLAHAVPRKLFSSFLEHMATATTGGVLAELLSNPVFAKRHYLTPHQLEVLKKNGGAIDRYWKSKDSEAFERDWSNGVLWSGFGPAIFDDETDQRIPLPWARVGDGRVTPAVGRVGHAIRLFGAADRDNSSALRQVIFPPVHRERRLLVSVVARMIGEARGKLEVSLNRPAGEPEKSPGETLASAEMLYAHGNGWKQLHAQLTLPEGVVEPREPLNFVIRWIAEDGIDVILDQVSILPFDHEAGFDPDVLAIASGQFAQLRWPGGNFASFYHWRQGVEPAIDRITVENQAWGGLDHNAIGTDEYIALCRRIGAEPHITVNAGTGSPEEAAAWVEYCNGDATTPMGSLRARNGHIEPYDVRVWEVGNELWGDFQGGNVGGHVNATRFASFASAMREASPTTLTLLATGNWFDLVDITDARLHYAAVDGRWQEELMRRAPNDIDMLSMHWLPFGSGFFPEDSAHNADVNKALLAQLVTAERHHLPRLLAVLDGPSRDKAKPAIEIALTEWCPVGSTENDRLERMMPDNAGAALWGAACFHTLLRADRITMASPNGFFHGGSIKKVAGTVYKDPVVDVMLAYRAFEGARMHPVHMSGPGYDTEGHADLGAPEQNVPWIDVIAATDPEGGIIIALLNRDETRRRDVDVTLPDPFSGVMETLVWACLPVSARATLVNPNCFERINGTLQCRNGIFTATLEPYGILIARRQPADH